MLAILTMSAVQAQAPKSFPYYIEWESVSGAGGYRIEIETPEGEPVLQKDIPPEDHSVELVLPGGNYRFRLVTLNKLMRFENATDWSPIEVVPYTPPEFISLSPLNALTGDKIELVLKAKRMALQSRAALYSPSGKSIPLTIQKTDEDTYRLTGPAFAERGAYSFIILNPPDKSLWKNGILTVRYPEPAIAKPAREEATHSAFIESEEERKVTISGRNFSPEVAARITPAADFTIINTSSSSLSILLDANLKPGTYEIAIANAKDQPSIPAGIFILHPPETVVAVEPVDSVEPPATLEPNADDSTPVGQNVPPEKQKRVRSQKNWLALGGGANIQVLFGKWAQIYDSPALNGNIHADFFLTNGLRPQNKQTFDFSIGIRADYSRLYTTGKEIYVPSSMENITIIAYPALSYSFRLIRFTYFAGAGVNRMAIRTESGGISEARQSVSIREAYGTGINIAFTPHRLVSFDLTNSFFYLAGKVPVFTYSASAGVSFMIPIYR